MNNKNQENKKKQEKIRKSCNDNSMDKKMNKNNQKNQKNRQFQQGYLYNYNYHQNNQKNQKNQNKVKTSSQFSQTLYIPKPNPKMKLKLRTHVHHNRYKIISQKHQKDQINPQTLLNHNFTKNTIKIINFNNNIKNNSNIISKDQISTQNQQNIQQNSHKNKQDRIIQAQNLYKLLVHQDKFKINNVTFPIIGGSKNDKEKGKHQSIQGKKSSRMNQQKFIQPKNTVIHQYNNQKQPTNYNQKFRKTSRMAKSLEFQKNNKSKQLKKPKNPPNNNSILMCKGFTKTKYDSFIPNFQLFNNHDDYSDNNNNIQCQDNPQKSQQNDYLYTSAYFQKVYQQFLLNNQKKKQIQFYQTFLQNHKKLKQTQRKTLFLNSFNEKMLKLQKKQRQRVYSNKQCDNKLVKNDGRVNNRKHNNSKEYSKNYTNQNQRFYSNQKNQKQQIDGWKYHNQFSSIIIQMEGGINAYNSEELKVNK